ncbi:MAG: hypothetical protein ACQESR_17290 [Planctomycetota bacterium]
MESCTTQAVLPLVGLAAETVIRDRYGRPDRRQPAKPLPKYKGGLNCNPIHQRGRGGCNQRGGNRWVEQTLRIQADWATKRRH